MADSKTEGMRIAGACRLIGWKVETGSARKGWRYRVSCPPCAKGDECDHRVEIHQSPSDFRWETTVWRFLNNHGYEEVKAAFDAEKERKRLESIERDRVANDRKTQLAAARSAAVAKAAGAPQPVNLQWLTTPTDRMEPRLVVMTPEAARKVLADHNPLNRKESAGRVTYFTNLIEDGEFGTTHQGGAFDWFGRLQDGQSRLRAIDVTGKAQPMWWWVGMDPQNFARTDTGGLRSGADTAYIMLRQLAAEDADGIDYTADSRTVSSTAKMLVVIDKHGPNAHIRQKSGRVSNDTLGTAMAKYGQPLLDAVTRMKKIKRRVKKLNPSALSTAVYLITMRLPEGDPRVEDFFAAIETGQNLLGEHDPVALLRDRVLNDDFPTGQWEQAALILTAWNHRAKRTPNLKQLVWRKNQNFPAQVFLPPPVSDVDAVDSDDRVLVAA